MIPAQQIWPPEFADRYRRKGYWTGETFSSLLRDRAATFGDRVAVVGASQRWTYDELNCRADTAAAFFVSRGLRPGDRAVVQLPNIPEFVSVIFGLFRAGVLPVFALPAHRDIEIAHFAAAAEAAACIIPDRHASYDYREMARRITSAGTPLGQVIVVGGDAGGFVPFPEYSAHVVPDVAEPLSSSVAFLQLSGGSTGLSKLIPRTHDDYIYSFRRSAEICRLTPDSVYMATLPVAHNFPMSSPGICGTFDAGGTVVLSPSPDPDTCFPIIEREGVTITGMVPPLALAWLEAVPDNTHDISSLAVLQVGGAKLTPEVARRIRAAFPHTTLQQVFGMAEGLVNYTDLDDAEEILVNTQGKPMSPDDEILVVDDAGVALPVGTPGHLLTRGPYTIRAYHNAGDANTRAFTADGYYRTGDIVSVRPDGYLVVHGRATDQINRGGEKVSPEEVEDVLLAHPAILDAALVGIPDELLGEKTCAFIVPRGDAPTMAAVKEWVRSRGIAAFKVPDKIVFMHEFPSTGVGKTSRKDLRGLLRSQATVSAVGTR